VECRRVPIHDLTYQHWQGTPSGTPAAWILGWGQLRTVLRRRIVRVLLLAAGAFFLAWLVLLYLEIRLAEGGLENLPDFVRIDADMMQRYLAWQLLLHGLLCIAAGADSIALDRRHKALQIYLSRPLRVPDYVLGKAMPILMLLSATTWIPALLILLLKTIATGSLAWLVDEPAIIPAILAYSAALIATATLVTLAISSLSPSPGLASAQLFVFIAVTGAAAELFAGLTRAHSWQLISVVANLRQVRAWCFGKPLPYDVSPWATLAVLVLLLGGCVLLLRARVRAVDVVGGA
jgi:hypothetical protein